MPVIDDDDRPKKKMSHEIGQELALLSVEELRERVALLKEEIARLEAAIAAKQASRAVRRHVLQELGRVPSPVALPAWGAADFSSILIVILRI